MVRLSAPETPAIREKENGNKTMKPISKKATAFLFSIAVFAIATSAQALTCKTETTERPYKICKTVNGSDQCRTIIMTDSRTVCTEKAVDKKQHVSGAQTKLAARQ